MPQPGNKQLQPPQPFRWEQIDRGLISLKTTDLAIETNDKIDAEERRIRFENQGNCNSNTVPTQILAMKEKFADEYAKQIYQIYCDVWETQGNAKSAAFVRAVLNHAVLVSLQARASSIAAEFSRSAVATAFNINLRNAHLESLDVRMRKLEGRWRRKLEAEAKELEHKERLARNAVLGHAKATLAWVSKTSSPGHTPEPPNPGNVDHQHSDAPPVNAASKSALDDRLNLEIIIRKVRNPQSNTILTVPEAALYFSVTPRTIHRWVAVGRLTKGSRRGAITIASVRRSDARRSKKRSTL